MKKIKNENKVLAIIAICLIVLIVLLLIIFQVLLPKLNESQEETEDYVPNNTLDADDLYALSKNEWITLQLSGEETRIKYYLGTFISGYICDGNYADAYEVLNKEFKENYFKTYEDFENYASAKYPSIETVSYGDFQRQGDYYIVKITIEDFTGQKEAFTQTFIVKENDFNEYEISFSV